VHSEEGQGSLFSFSLRARTTVAPPVVSSADAISLEGLRLLVVSRATGLPMKSSMPASLQRLTLFLSACPACH
jgi:hypothetical protein